MKNLKLIIIALLLTITSISVAQRDSVYIVKYIDDMSDKTYYYPSRKIVCSSEDKKIGFTISLFLDNKNEKIKVHTLKVAMVNIGSCVEKNEIIILLDNDTKIKAKSWNDFNCKGDAWFDLSDSDIDNLSKFKIKKIKVTNGRSFESYTHEITDNNDYFIQTFFAIQNNKIKEEKK